VILTLPGWMGNGRLTVGERGVVMGRHDVGVGVVVGGIVRRGVWIGRGSKERVKVRVIREIPVVVVGRPHDGRESRRKEAVG
jgi:hypothetical protein